MAHSPATSVDPAEVLEQLKAGHQRFLEGHSIHPHTSLERLKEVAAGQHPVAAVLGCADSRVPVELLFDSGLGDLFVVRSAGNTAFTAAIGSLEYAVAHLGVTLIIVLGHERCGAVGAALDLSAKFSPSLAQVVGQVRMELLAAGAMDDLDKACRVNSLHSAQNLADSSLLITDLLRQGRLQIQSAYYDLDTAEIEWLGAVQPTPIN